MKKTYVIILLLLLVIIKAHIEAALKIEDFNLDKPPYDQITDIDVTDLEPGHKTSYNDYSQKDLLFQKKYDGSWSTANHIRLDSLNINVKPEFRKCDIESASACKTSSINVQNLQMEIVI